MEESGFRQAVRRACASGTLVSCESCGQVRSVSSAPSKAVLGLGWWRPDHDLVLCSGCYVPRGEQVFVEQVFDGGEGVPPASGV